MIKILNVQLEGQDFHVKSRDSRGLKNCGPIQQIWGLQRIRVDPI